MSDKHFPPSDPRRPRSRRWLSIARLPARIGIVLAGALLLAPPMVGAAPQWAPASRVAAVPVANDAFASRTTGVNTGRTFAGDFADVTTEATEPLTCLPAGVIAANAGSAWYQTSSVGSNDIAIKFSPLPNTAAYAVYSGTSLANLVLVGCATGATNIVLFTAGGGVFIQAVGANNIGSNAYSFQLSLPRPSVTSIAPSTGSLAGGTAVTITGTDFLHASTVKFGTANAASFTVNSTNSITAVSPAGTGTVDITVTSINSSAVTAASKFTFAAATATATAPAVAATATPAPQTAQADSQPEEPPPATAMPTVVPTQTPIGRNPVDSAFGNASTRDNYGPNDSVRLVRSGETVAQIPVGRMSPTGEVSLLGVVREEPLGATYAVVRRESDGMVVRRWIGPNDPLRFSIQWSNVSRTRTYDVSMVSTIPLDESVPQAGQAVRRFDGTDERIFAWDAASKSWRAIPDVATFQAQGLHWCGVTSADETFTERARVGDAYPASGGFERADYPSCGNSASTSTQASAPTATALPTATATPR